MNLVPAASRQQPPTREATPLRPRRECQVYDPHGGMPHGCKGIGRLSTVPFIVKRRWARRSYGRATTLMSRM